MPAGWQKPEAGRSVYAVARQPQQVRQVFGWHMNGMRPGTWGMRAWDTGSICARRKQQGGGVRHFNGRDARMTSGARVMAVPGCFARRQGGQVCRQTCKKLSCARALRGPALVRGVCRPVRGFLLLFWFTDGQDEATLQQQGCQLGNGQAHNRAPRTFHPVYQKSSLPLNGVGAGLVARFVCRHIGP